jgi:hypothetical protein
MGPSNTSNEFEVAAAPLEQVTVESDGDAKLDVSSSTGSEEAKQQLASEACLFMEGLATFRQRY